MTALQLPDCSDVLAAAARISDRVLKTPTLSRASLNESLGFEVVFKCENLQRTGSFKFRGASNAVGRLVETLASADERPVVTTHSSGNHGAALALAASQAGLDSIVVVPKGANPLKRAAVERYGGQIVDSGETLADREASLATVVDEHDAFFIPPYDHPDIIAGQGTAALELMEEAGALDEVWVPVGGGGLASGTLLALSGASDTVVRGVEPELADDAYWSLLKGSIQPQKPPLTVADGLRTALGQIPFQLFQQHRLSISRVSEAEILTAQALVWQRLKLVVEPSGVVPLAGLLAAARAEPEAYRGGRYGVIFSGGNALLPTG
ncbi:MAG: threonine/serine dehydratase [Gammaproteobacteria bacterium]|nr:MAG: threonine/serine dehydratase [Gammaproteobacteria bacterium]